MSWIASGAETQRHEPSYLALGPGALMERAEQALAGLDACQLCPRRCGVNRLSGQVGYCRAGRVARVASYGAHHGEEPPLSGSRGSGTIFFSYCTARCLFCQNDSISQFGEGSEVTIPALASVMIALQRRGCHNINLVTPTHYAPQILAAVADAVSQGLRIPVVYNTGGYETVDTLRLLAGIVDIYLPDAKYADDEVARALSGFEGYVEANRAALLEMKRQVGSALLVDEARVAYRGIVLRHLVLPEGLSQTPEVLAWIARELGSETYVSLMAQYHPAHRATGHPKLGRRLYSREYRVALEALQSLGLVDGWSQGLERVY